MSLAAWPDLEAFGQNDPETGRRSLFNTKKLVKTLQRHTKKLLVTSSNGLHPSSDGLQPRRSLFKLFGFIDLKKSMRHRLRSILCELKSENVHLQFSSTWLTPDTPMRALRLQAAVD